MARGTDGGAVPSAPGEEPSPEPVWLDPFLDKLFATGPAAAVTAAVSLLEARRPDLALPVLEDLAVEVRVAMAIAYEQGRWAVITALRERGVDYHATIRRDR